MGKEGRKVKIDILWVDFLSVLNTKEGDYVRWEMHSLDCGNHFAMYMYIKLSRCITWKIL